MPALCDVLRANPQGVLVLRDELAGLIAELDREGMEGSRSFYLTGWSGKTFQWPLCARVLVFIALIPA